jgi:hypothetical protein
MTDKEFWKPEDAENPEQENPEHIERSAYAKESLKVYLTDEEKDQYRDELVQCIQEIAQAQSDLKAMKTTFQKDISAKEALKQSLAQKLANGYEYRPVQVVQVKDYHEKTVAYIREDTGEVIRSRIMDSGELQKFMFPADQGE